MQNINSIYKGKKIFLTGITGFKGSWLALWLLKMGAEVKGYALPPETQPNHFNLLQLSCDTSLADIRDGDKLQKEVVDFQPDIVFHLAAQPLVRRSYRNPTETYSTNVIGTLNLLEACRAASPKAIVVVTSDKVYENNEWHWPYRESDHLGGHDLYSSSKACTEILTSSFQRSFFPIGDYSKKHECLIATTRAGNVIGGGDWSEDRLIPDTVKATSQGKVVEIRSPYAVRPWQHVLDPLSGYLTLGAGLLEGRSALGKAWNFGPATNDVKTVKDIMHAMQQRWVDITPNYPTHNEEPHEASLLAVDSSQAHQELKWKPLWETEKAIEKTVDWYKSYYENVGILTEPQLDEYLSEAKLAFT